MTQKTETKAESQMFDPPLPPPASKMRMAEPEHFMPERSDSFVPISQDNFVVRDLNIEALTGGLMGMRVYRGVAGATTKGTPWHWHEWGFQVGYITRGWAEYEFEGIGRVRFEAGTAVFQLPWNRHREIEQSDDFEAIEITLPGQVKTVGYNYNHDLGKYETFVAE